MNLDTFKSNEMSNKKFIVTQYLFIIYFSTKYENQYLPSTHVLKHNRCTQSIPEGTTKKEFRANFEMNSMSVYFFEC